MACAQIPDLPLEQFSRELIRKWVDNHVPLSGSMELDLRCNLRCLHCYRDGEWSSDVMGTEEVKRALDQIAAAGTVWILFTGGEIFLRPDFFEIYHHAKRLGLMVSLFTNGTTVTERIADRLRDEPPYVLEVSLYGFSEEVYERVTGVPGSRAKCYRGVELLHERGVPLKLKTVVMRTNQHELSAMADYASALGVPFKFDSMINPNFNGALVPCNVRLSPKEVVDTEFSIPGRLEEFRAFFDTHESYRSAKVFACGAGSRTFHVDPYGNVTMCLLLRDPAFSLRDMSFQEIWNERFPPIYTQMRPPEHQCNSCNLTALCGKCPAWSDMEKGRLDARVEWSCEVGHRRAAKIGRWNGPLNQYAASIEQTEARGRGCEEREVLLPVLPS